MKIAPTVADLLAGFPKQEHQIDRITGQPERMALNTLIEDITANAASIPTLKGGGLFGHTATCMSPTQYATIPLSQPFLPAPPPGALTFATDATAAARDDGKLLYYNSVYAFELESNLATALKNIMMAKLDESAYIVLKQQYVGYQGRSVYDFIDHLITTYGEKTDDMVKANLKALTEDFDCSGPSIEQLYIRQNDLQAFAVGTSGAITDAWWMLQTTHVIESSGVLNKAVRKWQATTSTYKTKAQFILDFNEYHKDYLSKCKHTPDPIANNVQPPNAEMEALRNMVLDSRIVINQVVDAQNDASAREEASNISSARSTIPTVVTTQPHTALQNEVQALRTALAASEARNQHGNPSGRGGGRGRRTTDRGAGRGHGRRPVGVLGTNSDQDKRLTRHDDGRTTKRFGNQNYCHTHGWDISPTHNSSNCSYPDKHHISTATAENTHNGCNLYKRLSHKS